jgi:hypothetical protein
MGSPRFGLPIAFSLKLKIVQALPFTGAAASASVSSTSESGSSQ